MQPSVAPLVVLDTNVRLDLFAFGAARADGLRAALQAGQLQAVCNAACRAEWERVLGYPKLRLDADQRAAAALAHDRWVQVVAAVGQAALQLPRCRDPDDQKFLQLAVDSGAVALLSRDAEVLRLARRMRLGFGIAVLQPHEFASILDG